MTSVLLVGGPEHGRRHTVYGALPSAIVVSVPTSASVLSVLEPIEPTSALPYETIYYTPRRYVTSAFRPEPITIYVNGDGRRWGQAGNPQADDLFASLYLASVPRCVVPGCSALAPRLFVAEEHGKLAGRYWKPGDEIRLCAEHGADVWRASYTYGIDELPEWMRLEANLDALDGYDVCTDILYSDQIYHRRGRGLRVEKAPTYA